MLRRAAVLLAVAAVLSGCGKPRAKTPPVPPAPLVTPAPPDRVIVPAPRPVAVAPPSQEPAAPPAVARPPEAAPARRTPPPAAPPPVVVPPEQPAASSSPPPVLQTTPNPREVEEQALALIAAADRDLKEVGKTRLSANARAQYESAQGFIRQAQTALGINNVVLARELAEKAASLASQLRR